MLLDKVKFTVTRELRDILDEVEIKLREVAQQIEGRGFSSSGYVDGSYVLDERRGAFLSVFSTASLSLRGNRFYKRMKGSEYPVPYILIPKVYGESRSSMLMEIAEFISGLDLIRRGTESLFMDGSYLSVLMSPFGAIRDVASRFSQLPFSSEAIEVAENLGETIILTIGEVLSSKDPYNIFISTLRVIDEYGSLLYNELSKLFKRYLGYTYARKDLLDYSMVYVEETTFMSIINTLLEEAKERDVGVFWVAKDSESRVLAEKEQLLGWFTDLTLLDYSWRNLGNIFLQIDSLPPVGFPKEHVCPRKLRKYFTSKWNKYAITYFKLGVKGAVIQLSFPLAISRDMVNDALKTLLNVSDKRYGYPRPLSYAHNLAVLDQRLARLIADELWRSNKNPLLKSILAPSGRYLLGLR